MTTGERETQYATQNECRKNSLVQTTVIGIVGEVQQEVSSAGNKIGQFEETRVAAGEWREGKTENQNGNTSGTININGRGLEKKEADREMIGTQEDEHIANTEEIGERSKELQGKDKAAKKGGAKLLSHEGRTVEAVKGRLWEQGSDNICHKCGRTEANHREKESTETTGYAATDVQGGTT